MMMEREFARFFVGLVNELIVDNGCKERLFEALRQYKSLQALDELLDDLRDILDEPSKLELYEYMRPLVLLHHQLEFSQRVPNSPGLKLRTIRLQRKPGESLGFAVRGGFEHGVGIFVTQLTPGSQADRQGLKLGDEIVRVNGFTISEAVHDDVLNLIKARDEIVLRVTHVGMIPVKEQTSVPVKWNYVNEMEADPQTDLQNHTGKPRDLKIFVDTTGYASFGCGILSGPSRFPGIFIEKVRPGSLAEEVGLEAGDQIVQVNETNFRNITHEQAVLAMKSSRQLTMIIRQRVGMKLFSQLSEQRSSGSGRSNNSSYSYSVASSTASQPTNHSQNPWGGPSGSANHRVPDLPSSQPSSETQPARSERESLSAAEEPLDESELIAQQLEHQALKPSFWGKPHPEETQSLASSSSASISTSTSVLKAAEVHPDQAAVEKGKKDEAQKEKTSPGSSSNFSAEIREELEERRKTQQSSPLSGAAAVAAQRNLEGSFAGPGLLGVGASFTFVEDVPPACYHMFTPPQLEGRSLRLLKFKKTDDLGVGLEGGIGSPLAGKIIVSIIFDDGVAKKSGKMKVGDQLMAVNGQKLLDITVTKALTTIESLDKDTVELLFCESTLINEEDTVTYF